MHSKTTDISLTILFLALTAMVWNLQSVQAVTRLAVSLFTQKTALLSPAPVNAAVRSPMVAASALANPTVSYGVSFMPGQGDGRVTVAAINTDCVKGTSPQGQGPFNWEVVQGGTYSMTITNVTECMGDSIKVFIQSTPTGNFCLTANKTAVGVYVVNQFTMPNPACFTYPISYKCDANAGCNNDDTFNARGPNGEASVHLRASIFGPTCNWIGEDQNCLNEQCPQLTVACPANISQPNDPGRCDAVVNYTTPTADGGCPPVTVSCVPASGTTFPVGTTTVTCTATDGDTTPHTATCTFDVTVTDNEAPQIDCVANKTISCPDSPTFDEPTVKDNCDPNPTVTPSDMTFPGACPGTYQIKRTWTATDAKGNSASCSQTITVEDKTAPTIGQPGSNATIECPATPVFTPPTAMDTCDSKPRIVEVSEVRTPGDCPNIYSITKTWKAVDCSSNESGTVSQTITVQDTKAPVISVTALPAKPPQLLPGQCEATVTFTATAMDDCRGSTEVICQPPSGSAFGPGVTTVNCTSSDGCNTGTYSFPITVYTSIRVFKFYDANANGEKDGGELPVNGVKIVLSGAASATQYTTSTLPNPSGSTTFIGLLPGNYTITEVLPNTNWQNTTPLSVTVNGLTCPASVTFGNYCTSPSGGLTLGFWSNKNGSNILAANPGWVALLNGLNLKDAAGNDFTVTTYAAFRTWLLNGTATNMAYMLSVQTAAMALNINYGSSTTGPPFVKGNAFDACSHMTIAQLVAEADAKLGADGFTPSGDPNRAMQESLKNCIDRLNNNGPVVNPTPCQIAPY